MATLSIEELADLEVTSVSKKAESQFEAPAAVYVITQEDIRRSGATTLVEALRLAPGVEVARINSNQWAVGVRGFQSRLARSVLVLIDGRSVYSPLFAGVYWEAQDTLLDDVERIEVIRGPGGTLWGANAVNGVVNIITRRASDTQGTLVRAGAGSEDRAFGAVRHGGKLGEATSYRLYGKYLDRDAQHHPDGADFDDWHFAQGGFRADSGLGPETTLTLQGGAYSSRNGVRAVIASYTAPHRRTVVGDAEVSGANVLARLTRSLGEAADVRVQLYYDRTDRGEPQFREKRDTVDLDIQGRFPLPRGHDVTWGAGYRWTSGEADSVATIVFAPSRRVDQLASVFLQDEVAFSRRLRLTAGTKVEHNDYSGTEVQPSLRLAFLPSADQVIWVAASRGVRAPSRVEHDLSLTAALAADSPTFLRIQGDRRFVAEKAEAYEAGYRLRASPRLVFDGAVFYNRYRDLLSLEPGSPFSESDRLILPSTIANGTAGRGRGVELAADVIPNDALKLRASYSFLELELGPEAGSADRSTGRSIERSSPRHQLATAAYLDLPRDLELDLTARYVAAVPAQATGDYVSVDLRLAWRPISGLELSLVGTGLPDDHHSEFGPVEIQRGIFGAVAWRF